MKYVLEWTYRVGGSAQENHASIKRALEMFNKWSPSTTVHQFVARVDGRGGFTVIETDDPTAMAQDCALFLPVLEYSAHPVIEVNQHAAALAAAVDFNESV